MPALAGKGGPELGAVLTGDGFLFRGWRVGHPIVEKQEDSLSGGCSFFSMNSGDLCVGQELCLCCPFNFIPL